jgi:tRNA (adenine57-N1/adenine58-N1)-methyltransferase
MSGRPPLREGEIVALWGEKECVVLPLRRGSQAIHEHGVIDLTEHIGRPPGQEVIWSGARYALVRPSLDDLLGRLKRTAQIVTAKDGPQLLHLAGIGPGHKVMEAGAGSGALTMMIAWAVGDTGRLVSYDRREDFLSGARRNLEQTGLSDRIDFRLRDVARDGFDETEADAIVLDLAEPWEVAPHARRALVIGGHIATFTPTFNQLERTVRALRGEGFSEIRSIEILERTLHVGEGGTRPDFEMLGHTGFLTGGRRSS